MKRTVIFLIAIPFSMISCAVPQTRGEARAWFRTNSYVVKKEYSIASINLGTAETRLHGFVDKCLRKTATHTAVGTYGARSSYSSTFRPTFEKRKDRLTLYLQRDVQGTNMTGVPKGGAYDFILEIFPNGSGVSVFSARSKSWGEMTLGNILDDAESWLNNKGQFCPRLG